MRLWQLASNMMCSLCILAFLPVLFGYDATWESLDSRPLPRWYPDAKIGIFIHWGVFSVPSFGSEWFWQRWEARKDKDTMAYVNATEGPRFAYADYAQRFDATLYDPHFWANIFSSAGAQYVVLTSKHHEGYCMWDSRSIPSTWNWNAMDVGPRRDLLGELAEAVRKSVSIQTKKPLKFGAYHSLYEWFNPAYLHDKNNNFTSSVFVDTKTLPELVHLIEKYKIEIIWSDGDWEADSDYWKSKEFLAWLATNSSVKETVVWNDRWGKGTRCTHGSFWNCADRYIPNTTMQHYFESCITLDKHSWGANRRSSAPDYLTAKELLYLLVQTISRNGNFLLNVGPSADGTINPIMVERLLQMGDWLLVNGEAVYNTRSWGSCSEDRDTIFYTRTIDQVNGDVLYVFLTEWRKTVKLACPEPTSSTTVRMLGVQGGADFTTPSDYSGLDEKSGKWTMTITLPLLTPDIVPCQHVWVLALEGIGNLGKKAASRLRT